MRHSLFLAALFASPLGAQTGYLIDSDLDVWFSIDLATGAVQPIGSTAGTGLDTAADLTFREDNGAYYTIDMNSGVVGTIDPATGAFSARYQTYLGGWQSLAWDPVTKKFYLATNSNQTYSLDPATGNATALGGGPTTLTTAMDVGPDGTLYSVGFANGMIYTVDKTTGQHTALVQTIPYLQSFAIDPQGRWYGISTATASLYEIDPATGQATLVGPNTGTSFVKAFDAAETWVQRHGQGCADGNQEVRRIDWMGTPNLSSILLLSFEPGTAPTVGIVLLGVSITRYGASSLPIDLGPFGMPGCRLYTGPNSVLGPVAGGVPVAVGVPNASSLVGLRLYAQGALLDPAPSPANPAGAVVTDYARIVISR
ncbi:MAG: hypothetical protein Fur0037_17280 [Planctomycetota bacterium]